ncbi:MAG TPA: hypothetical protein VK771_10310, partial [Acidimicrobiia bacterium]|nr:hypothetical protein [Acidimicrobiia bacterium]
MDLDTTSPTGGLAGLDPDDVDDAYRVRHLGELSDEQLFDVTAAVVAHPRYDRATSFTLHAPLELLARRALLRVVPPDRRDGVRKRMVWVAATYERAGHRLEAGPGPEFESPASARSVLLHAAREADLALVDGAASWLSRHASAAQVMAVADSTVSSLSGAGHANIYFFHLARTATGNRAALGLLRPLMREVARDPALRVEWTHDGIVPCG